MRARGTLRLAGAAAVLLGALTWTTRDIDAHKAITSKFLFNEDVFPVVKARCGQCHVDGGVAPMSLMTYDDAAPWAESIRIELLNEAVPDWHPLKLNARELDLLLVWATGGAPRGKAENTPPPVPLVNTWAAGAPDLTLPMREPFVLAGPLNDATHDVTLPLTGAAGRTLTAVDLLPGTPAIVRSAVLTLTTPDGAPRDLGTWHPGRGAALALPAPVTIADGATFTARITYKRTWKYEGQELKDASTVGLYFGSRGTAAAAKTPRP